MRSKFMNKEKAQEIGLLRHIILKKNMMFRKGPSDYMKKGHKVP